MTDVGHTLHKHAIRIPDEIAAAERAISTHHVMLQGKLKISVPVSFGTLYLAPLLAEFTMRHPAVKLHVEASDQHANLTDGDFDMAFRIGRLPDSTLIARKIGELKLVVCCSPTYVQRKGMPTVPNELCGHDCLLYGLEMHTGWEFWIDSVLCKIEVQGTMQTNNGEFILDAAIAGRGIARLPEFIANTALQEGLLVPVLTSYEIPHLQANVVYPRHRHGLKVVEELTAFLAQHLRNVSRSPLAFP
ncbi:LysR family transcriptional regulator [Burkholderia sp. Bp8989]|nr:LysR family transcriptional regulator [Burkholderia sp. Bp8995]RQS48443.1 LysR family transcriptional regulator [Burkholderia sp. Bp8989]